MSEAFNRLIRWRDFGDNPDPGYCAGSKEFGDDVQAVLAELAALREPAGDARSIALKAAKEAHDSYMHGLHPLDVDTVVLRTLVVEAALAAVAPKLRAAQWPPIETAPKTTRSRLVWCPDRQNIYIVSWWAQENAWAHVGGGGRILTETPTHWQTLPEPPATIRAGADDAE